MTEAFVRPAHVGDIDDLVRMRGDFTFEHGGPALPTNPGYEEECRAFLESAIAGDAWQIWVAELGGAVVSHAYVALIEKVPRPIYVPRRIAYLTNVYTLPDLRGRGIGAAVIQRAQEAARDADVELIIVWPSDESIDFYEREGFKRPDDVLIWSGD